MAVLGQNKGLGRYKRQDNAIIVAGGNLGHTVCVSGATEVWRQARAATLGSFFGVSTGAALHKETHGRSASSKPFRHLPS